MSMAENWNTDCLVNTHITFDAFAICQPISCSIIPSFMNKKYFNSSTWDTNSSPTCSEQSKLWLDYTEIVKHVTVGHLLHTQSISYRTAGGTRHNTCPGPQNTHYWLGKLPCPLQYQGHRADPVLHGKDQNRAVPLVSEVQLSTPAME